MIEKEWPKDIETRDIGSRDTEIDNKIDKALQTPPEETPDQWLDLEGFEAALKAEVKGEGEAEERLKQKRWRKDLNPSSWRNLKNNPGRKYLWNLLLRLMPCVLDEEFFDQLAKGELSEGKFLEEEPLRPELSKAPLPGEELLEEKLPERELPEKELSMDLIEEELKEEEVKFVEEVLRGDEISFIEELLEKKIGRPPEEKEEKVEIFRELETPDLIEGVQTSSLLEEVVPQGIAPEVHDSGFLKAEAAPEFVHEPQAAGILKEAEPPRLVPDIPMPGLLKEEETPKGFLEGVHPPGRLFDRQMEEVIGKGVQEMMEGFITKVLPEMTQNILNLTVERIEKMVKEIRSGSGREGDSRGDQTASEGRQGLRRETVATMASKILDKSYDPHRVEEKWYAYWEKQGYFRADENSTRPPYSIVIPPPNVTGVLHIGHALNNTLQDILVRFKRMKGYEALWMPGTDHAGIATQNVVEKQLAAEGLDRHALGREKFVERVWKWKAQSGGTIISQLKKLGASCDWSRERFTMDEGLSEAVKEVFVRLYQEGLIYRSHYIINWCPRCQTALADLEVEHEETLGKLYHLKYPLERGGSVSGGGDDPAGDHAGRYRGGRQP